MFTGMAGQISSFIFFLQIMGVGTIRGTAMPQQSRPESAPPLEMFLLAGTGPGGNHDQVLISKVTQASRLQAI